MEENDFAALLRGVSSSADGRKLRLFAVACCRRVHHLIRDTRCSRAVDVTVNFIDGRASKQELAAAHQSALDAAAERRPTKPALWVACRCTEADPRDAARLTSDEAADVAVVNGRADQRRQQAAMLHDIFGHLWQSENLLSMFPRWRSPAVVEIARGIYQEDAFREMPLLADALREAGCQEPQVLGHCEGPYDRHERGCWVIDCVLGH